MPRVQKSTSARCDRPSLPRETLKLTTQHDVFLYGGSGIASSLGFTIMWAGACIAFALGCVAYQLGEIAKAIRSRGEG